MKTIIILLLFIPVFVSAQLKVEWQREFEGKNLRVAGFHFVAGNIITCLNHYTFKISPNGNEMESFGEHSGGLVMQPYNNKLLYIGGPQFSIRTEEGVLEKQIMLLGEDNSNISAKDGKVVGGGLFVIKNYNYLIKFNLLGEHVFTRKLENATTNFYLDADGANIYIYSHVADPLLGARLMQYDTLGHQKWSIAVGDVRSMLADEQGNCFVAALGGDGDCHLTKYNTEGKVDWTVAVTGQVVRGSSKHGDSILVCGHLSKNGATSNWQRCAYSIISASTGKLLTQQVLDLYEDPKEREYFDQIASDGINIYAGGTHSDENPRCFLVKLSNEGKTTDLKDAEATKTSFNIFPNPGGSKFTISCGDVDVNKLQVTVRNIAGKVVYENKIICNADKSFTLDMGKQAAGNYTVEIGEGKGKVVKKIIVE